MEDEKSFQTVSSTIEFDQMESNSRAYTKCACDTQHGLIDPQHGLTHKIVDCGFTDTLFKGNTKESPRRCGGRCGPTAPEEGRGRWLEGGRRNMIPNHTDMQDKYCGHSNDMLPIQRQYKGKHKTMCGEWEVRADAPSGRRQMEHDVQSHRRARQVLWSQQRHSSCTKPIYKGSLL